MVLNVWEYGNLVGKLESTPNQGIVFRYTSNATRSISTSLPLSDKTYTQKECLPYFSGLLPDGEQRERLARAVHVSTESVMKLLMNYGRDIAGSLQIIPEDENPSDEIIYIPISEAEIEQRILSSSHISMMANSNDRIRLSLAGAMDKMPLYKKGEFWFLPSCNAASNVIIKPSKEYAANEYLCSLIAYQCGLPISESQLMKFGSQPAFVTTRFDRKEAEGIVKRLHQEDFCQALGIVPEKKYEEDGGPGFKECLSLIYNESAFPLVDIRRFLECTVFNYLIGNCDAHAKNFSFLYTLESTKKPRLAPFYDLVCTTIYPELSRQMAMKIRKTRDIDRITKDDLLFIDNGSKLMFEIIKDIPIRFKNSLDKVRNSIPEELEPLLLRITEDSNHRLQKLL